MNFTDLEVFNIYLKIKKELMANLPEVHYRQQYYTTKFRGDRFKNVNVSMREEGNHKILQIYVKYGKSYIKDTIRYNFSENYFDSQIKSNLNE